MNTPNSETQSALNSSTDPYETNYVLHRRFDRMGRLVGDESMKKLFKSHVMVIGCGGVGSWAAESLARSGVGQITIVDFDDICITNANRQLHALQGMVGKKKSTVMAERLQKINPQAKITGVVKFFNFETAAEIFALKPDYIIDAIDNLKAKCFLISEAKVKGIPLVTSGGAAARMDPTQMQLTDLSQTHSDPLCAQVRKILRTKYAFPREGQPFDVPCVFSAETPMTPIDLKYDNGEGFKCVCPQGQNNYHSCDQRNVIYGTSSFVTGAFGLAQASWVVRQITAGYAKKPIEEILLEESQSLS